MGPYLYRKARIAASLGLAGLLVVVLAAPLPGQRRPAEKPRGPRAIAVLEFVGEVPRLIPIVILDGGRFYDAGLYRATPRPMALEPGTVYEAERAGRSAGLFTITDATRAGQQWYALGDWRPAGMEEPPPAPAPSGPPARHDTGGFVFGPGATRDQDAGPDAAAPGAPPPPVDDDPDRPTIRRPGEPPAAEEPKAPPVDDDPDRPILSRPGEPAPAAAPALPDPDDDPKRPILRRGRPEAEKPLDTRPEELFADPEAVRTWVVAVSDATPLPRTLVDYEFRPGEEERMHTQLEKLAREAVARAAKARNLPAVHLPAARLAAARLENARLHAFDLDFDGAAEMVYTADFTLPASAKEPALTWHAALIARVDSEGQARRLWEQATSSDRLDVTRRLELVDAVDVSGNGRADLLFRSHGRGGHGYEAYAVLRHNAERIFDGAWTPDPR